MRKLQRASALIAALTTCLGLAVTTTSTAAPRAADVVYNPIWNAYSDKCVGLSGSEVRQWTCSGADSLYWRLGSQRSGHLQVINSATGQCLSVAGRSSAQGALLAVRACDDLNDQFWRFEFIGNYEFLLHNLHSGKYMSIVGNSSSPGAALNQWSDTGSVAQVWVSNWPRP
jgi:hypothetical protein